MIRVLSIDGGGVKGLIPAKILAELETLLREKTKDPNAHLIDYFDLVIGNSTGGILAGLLLCPNDLNPKKHKFLTKDLVDIYEKNSKKAFTRTIWRKIRTLWGLLDEKYSASGLEKMLKDNFYDVRMSDLLKPCVIPSYDIENRKTVFFNSRDAKHNAHKDILFRDVLRATTAAPSYFEPASIWYEGRKRYMIDGGLVANNPALCGLIEAHKIPHPKGSTKKGIFILSLGTGTDKAPIRYKDAKSFGVVRWLPRLIDIFMSTSMEIVDYHLRAMYDLRGHSEHYVRINSNLDKTRHPLDDISNKGLKYMHAYGDTLVAENKEVLRNVINQIT